MEKCSLLYNYTKWQIFKVDSGIWCMPTVHKDWQTILFNLQFSILCIVYENKYYNGKSFCKWQQLLSQYNLHTFVDNFKREIDFIIFRNASRLKIHFAELDIKTILRNFLFFAISENNSRHLFIYHQTSLILRKN